MNGVAKSLALAVVSLFNGKMLWLMLWPVLVSLAVWGIAAWVLWVKTALWVAEQLGRLMQPVVSWVPWDFSGLMLFSAHVILLLLFVPLVYLTALLILGVFGMDAMVDHVAQRHYPELARRRGGSLAGSLWNSLVALCGLVLLFIVTLPLMFIPPLWALAPVAVMGWVNQKILRYDAIAEHATPGEMAEVFAKGRGRLYTLGTILALVAYIPIVGFFAPVLFALAFIHYGLGALREIRGAPIEGEVVKAGPSVIEGEVVRD